MKQRPILAGIVFVVFTGVGNDATAQTPADIVFANGVIYTMDVSRPRVSSVVITDGRIVFTGEANDASAYRGPRTKWVDLAGATVVPGLVDSHGHLRNLGRLRSNVVLFDAASRDECVSRVRERMFAVAPGQWIRGRGWDESDWKDSRLPTWRDLEGTDANPVYMRRVDGHSAWLNRAALEACGITKDTPDPPGGRIVRFDDGEPTGIVVDNAEELVTAHIPSPTEQEMDAWMRDAILECNAYGLVGVHDAGATAPMIASWRRLGRDGELPLRIYAMVDMREEALDNYFAAGPTNEFGGRLVIRAIKIYADGSVGSRSAALLEPYSDNLQNTGLLINEEDVITRTVAKAVRAGFQPCIHAIGDRANRIVLDAYAATRAGTDVRPRIEHCQVLNPRDIERFASQGVIASMQPTHCTSDMPWVDARLGTARANGCYAWRSILDSGATMTFGSDFPVESANPMWGIYAAVTRCTRAGEPAGGWHPEQLVTVEEAVRSYTVGPAFASFTEFESGVIAMGMRGDLTVLDRDIFTTPPDQIHTVRARYTVIGGEIVYSAVR